jgi:hypothetical protein
VFIHKHCFHHRDTKNEENFSNETIKHFALFASLR